MAKSEPVRKPSRLEDAYARIVAPEEEPGEINLRHILFPSILAGLTILIIAYFWNITEHGIIFASFGSSAFLIYVTPESKYANIRNVLGAYPLAGFFGYLASEYMLPLLNHPNIALDYALVGGVAVGLTSLAMLFTRFEHPPAAGAALAFVLKQKPDVGAVFFLIGGGITLLLLTKVLTFLVKEEYELECAIRQALHHRSEEETQENPKRV